MREAAACAFRAGFDGAAGAFELGGLRQRHFGLGIVRANGHGHDRHGRAACRRPTWLGRRDGVQRIQLSADGHARAMVGDERIEPGEDRSLVGTRADDGEARACFQHGNEGIEQGERAQAALRLAVRARLDDALRTDDVPQGTNAPAAGDPLESVDDPRLKVSGGLVGMAAKHVRRFRCRAVSAERSRRRSMRIDDKDLDRTGRCSELGHAAR
jgi:hypothetical protein